MHVFQQANPMHIFIFQLCLIFSFLIFCRYFVAQIVTFVSHRSGTAKGKWPSSQHFSMVSFAWNWRKEKTEKNSSLWPCSLSHLNHVRWKTILSGLSVQSAYLPRRKETLFFGWVLHLSPGDLPGLFCCSNALVPSSFHMLSVPVKVLDFTEWRQLDKQGNHWGFYQSVPQN